MERIVRLAGAFWVALMLVALAGVPGTAEAQNRLCFGEVPDCIEGRFAEYWQQNGGLPVFGFPIGPARLENVGGGQFLVQPFERNRFELHPENQRPYDVLLGRLGDDRLRQLGRPWENEPKAPATSQAGCQYFAQTGHLVCNQFLNYWRTHGLNLDGRAGFTEAESLALFGLPLTEARVENGSDGRPYLTQWFERARFELHPEITADTVLLGLLGREVSAAPAQPTPTPPPPAADPCADVPEPRNGRIRPAKCVNPGTRIEIDVFGFQPNEEIGFWLTSPDGVIVGTRQTLNIGPSGAVNGLPFNTTNLTPGLWYFVFEGVSSRNQSVVYFKILGAQAAPPANNSCTDVPASVSGDIDPKCIRGGQQFEAFGVGFRPGERVGFYITAPDQSVVELQLRDGDATADTDGSFGIVGALPRGLPVGIYAITFEGVQSGHKAIVYFKYIQ